jgi:predicted metal-binding membrane protein
MGFSAMGAGAQILLSQAGWLAPDGTSLSPWLTASLLIAAGIYQLSTVKAACLAKCRHPLVFFLQYWKPGPAPAFAMGLRLGAYCVGCCWVLMSLGFIGGATNLLWMGAATLFMTFEKLPGIGTRLTGPAGLLLLAAGAWGAVQALQAI